MNNSQPEPAWYPDPIDPNRVRYWNGSQWSTETQPRWAPPQQTSVQPTAEVPPAAQTAPPTHEVRGSSFGREAMDATMSWRRFLAAFIDALICQFLSALPISVALLPRLSQRVGEGKGVDYDWVTMQLFPYLWWVVMLTLLVWFVYGLLMSRLAGGTAGQLITGLRVTSRSTEDAELEFSVPRPTWSQAAKRSLVRGMVATLMLGSVGSTLQLLGTVLCFVAVIMMNTHPQRLSLFDRAASTRLVFRKR